MNDKYLNNFLRAAVLFARERSDDERADKNPLQQRIDHQAKTKWLAVFLENKMLITYSPEKGSVTNQIYWSERWAIPREKWLSALWGIPACKDAKVYQCAVSCIPRASVPFAWIGNWGHILEPRTLAAGIGMLQCESTICGNDFNCILRGRCQR